VAMMYSLAQPANVNKQQAAINNFFMMLPLEIKLRTRIKFSY
jgi:hypothetical protein